MLIDELDITFKAGGGGRGVVSFGKMAKSGPDGGNGGKGGDIYVEGSSDLTLLAQFKGKRLIEAEKGVDGGKNKMTGAFAEDMFIKLPVGTTLLDTDTGETFDISSVGQRILLCQGGAPGIGNFDLRSPSNTTPLNVIPPGKGQTRNLHITLKFIANFGLIGLPSSGKSSLLNELTNARVKTAEYPFTTLSPNLGVLPNRKIIADIPGLIEGSSKGRGLGIKFLKHIEKVEVLLHCISCESSDPMKDYKTVRREMENYSKEMLGKKEIILITKHDLKNDKEITKMKNVLKKTKSEILVVSIHDEKSLNDLKNSLSVI